MSLDNTLKEECSRPPLRDPSWVKFWRNLTVLVDYTPLSLGDLWSYFGGKIGGSRVNFSWLQFSPIDVCKDIYRKDRELQFKYVKMNWNASRERVLAELDRRGLRPATHEELRSLAKMFPKKFRNFKIVALGSTCIVSGCHEVAIFVDNGLERRLDITWHGKSWPKNCLFLGVPKES